MPAKRKTRASTEQSQKKKRTPSPKKGASCSTKDRVSPNIAQCIFNVQIGRNSLQDLRKTSQASIITNISNIRYWWMVPPFERRSTFLTWHPKNSKLLLVGAKDGSIISWNCERLLVEPSDMIRGKGPGDTITNIVCHPEKQDEIYTSSLRGTVGLWNLEQRKYTELINLEQRYGRLHPGSENASSTWGTGMDIDFSGGSVIVGENTGFLSLMSLDGKLQWRTRMHKSKISHAEYFKRDSRFLVTASIDHTVKIWDTRFISGAKPEQRSVLAVLEHNFGVNSAYFSPSGSGRLLTTDQHSELRVYRAPLWNLERIIPHPHRQFQHLTPIKATWHPLEDIIVVGRYPDKQFPGFTVDERRTVDFFQAETGKCVHKLTDLNLEGIISLNRFNNSGDILASAMGVHIVIWRPKWQAKAPDHEASEASEKLYYKGRIIRPRLISY